MAVEYWYVVGAILVPGTLLASWVDFAQRRVPNWLNLTLLLIGLGLQMRYFGFSGLGIGLLGMLTGFGLLIVPWLMHGMGTGDVKLMAAIGAFMGPTLTFYSFGLGVIIGGVTAVIMIMSTGRLKMACANLGLIMAKCSHRSTMFSEFASAKSFGVSSQLLPYGVPLTGGTLVILAGKIFGLWGL